MLLHRNNDGTISTLFTTRPPTVFLGCGAEKKHVTDALRGNDYPSGFIQKHSITSRREEVEVERPKTTFTLPYISGLSEAIKHVLTPLGVKVVLRPLRILRQMLVCPKDPVPVEEHKGVVYVIPFVKCSSVYISQTGRSLKQCVSEHSCALKNGDIQTSALAEHVFKTDMQWTSASLRC